MRILTTLLLTFFYSAGTMGSQPPLKIVTSIHPLSLIVHDLAPENADIHTLIPPGSTPHTYQLRPSDRQSLAEADVIFWIGPTLETFLQRLLSGPDLHKRTQALVSENENPAESHGEHGHETKNEPHHDHHHEGTEDPHLWVSPEGGRELARNIHQRLLALRPSMKEQLDQRLKAFGKRLDRVESSIRKQLRPTESVDLFTYHDALNGFAEHFNLNLAGTLTKNPQKRPGPRHLNSTAKRIEQSQQPCLLMEPQFNRNWWESLINRDDVRVVIWDPLASEIDLDSGGYATFQKSIADAITQCL